MIKFHHKIEDGKIVILVKKESCLEKLTNSYKQLWKKIQKINNPLLLGSASIILGCATLIIPSVLLITIAKGLQQIGIHPFWSVFAPIFIASAIVVTYYLGKLVQELTF